MSFVSDYGMRKDQVISLLKEASDFDESYED